MGYFRATTRNFDGLPHLGDFNGGLRDENYRGDHSMTSHFIRAGGIQEERQMRLRGFFVVMIATCAAIASAAAQQSYGAPRGFIGPHVPGSSGTTVQHKSNGASGDLFRVTSRGTSGQMPHSLPASAAADLTGRGTASSRAELNRLEHVNLAPARARGTISPGTGTQAKLRRSESSRHAPSIHFSHHAPRTLRQDQTPRTRDAW